MEIYKKLAFIILPILITTFFASIIPRKREERKRFSEAADKFQDAFTDYITFLKRNTVVGNIPSTDNLGECLRAGYVARHLKAFEGYGVKS